MDEFALAWVRAARVAAALEVSGEDLLGWLSERIPGVPVGPGLTSYPGAAEHVDRYLRFRRDQAFVEAYLAAPVQNAVMWTIVPSAMNANPDRGTHSTRTLQSQDLTPQHRPALGDVAALELGSFTGYEHEFRPLVEHLGDSGAMLWVLQVNITNGRLDAKWFNDRFAYVSAVKDGDLFRPGHPDLDS